MLHITTRYQFIPREKTEEISQKEIQVGFEKVQAHPQEGTGRTIPFEKVSQREALQKIR